MSFDMKNEYKSIRQGFDFNTNQWYLGLEIRSKQHFSAKDIKILINKSRTKIS